MVEHLTQTGGYSNPFTRTMLILRLPGAPPAGPLSNPSVTENLEAFHRLAAWPIVMRVIVVYSDLRPAAMTGFSGLGNARVQIIDASGDAKVSAFFDLAEGCERKNATTVRQNFHQESLDTMKQGLQKAVQQTLRSQGLIATLPLRPAYMFRLCIKMCNHRDNGIVGYERRRFPPMRGGCGRGLGQGRGWGGP